MAHHNFKELIVWQKAREFVTKIKATDLYDKNIEVQKLLYGFQKTLRQRMLDFETQDIRL